MAEELKPNDVVQLKSGGPLMTVEESNDEQTDCVWMHNGKQQSGTFKTALLIKRDPNQGPRMIQLRPG